MRKIESFEHPYSCPNCTNDLWPVSTDFSYDQEHGARTRVTVQCQACREKFFCDERAHVRKSGYRCRYCQLECESLSLADDWTSYYKCVPCKVSYEHRYDPGLNDVHTINMYAHINGNLYVIRQFIRDNWTQIELLPPDPEDTVVIAQRFDFLLPNITPANIDQKLLTYLLFS
jgi:hypothetical protein